MTVQVGDEILVTTQRPATGGAVGRTEEGQVVFLRHTLPGETVVARVTEVSRSFARGDAIDIRSPHLDRVPAPCAYAHPGGCGGCDLQHAGVEAQLDWKSSVVSEHLSRIAHLDWVVNVEEVGVEPHGSRTRVRCAVDADGRLGLRASRRTDIIALNECWIADPSLSPAFSEVWTGFDEVELRAIGETSFAVARRDDGDESIYSIHSVDGGSLPADTVSTVRVGGHDFRVGPLSFWQSHRSAPDILTAAVLEGADVNLGDHVVDLYSGVGLFTVPLATAVGPTGRVTAVESSEDAVADATFNTRRARHVTHRNWRVTPRAMNDTVAAGDIVVMDPPRGGVGHAAMTALVRRAPRRVVYVSCDAATFARDLAVLLAADYRIHSLRAFDLFPMTEHVEIVAVLDAPR